MSHPDKITAEPVELDPAVTELAERREEVADLEVEIATTKEALDGADAELDMYAARSIQLDALVEVLANEWIKTSETAIDPKLHEVMLESVARSEQRRQQRAMLDKILART
jgi:hypothetical protein